VSCAKHDLAERSTQIDTIYVNIDDIDATLCGADLHFKKTTSSGGGAGLRRPIAGDRTAQPHVTPKPRGLTSPFTKWSTCQAVHRQIRYK
jgi:hypothetical protein